MPSRPLASYESIRTGLDAGLAVLTRGCPRTARLRPVSPARRGVTYPRRTGPTPLSQGHSVSGPAIDLGYQLDSAVPFFVRVRRPRENNGLSA
jgi:hypothetical protein